MRAQLLLASILLFSAGCLTIPGKIRPDLPQDESFVVLPRPIELVSGSSFDCGAESLHGVMRYYGQEPDFQQIADALYVSGAEGTFPQRIVQFANSRGYKVRMVEGSYAAIREAIDQGIPSIVMIRSTAQSNHFLVTKGYDPKSERLAFEFYHGWKWIFTAQELDHVWQPCGFLQLDFILSPLGVKLDQARNLESEGRLNEALDLYQSVLGEEPENLQARLGAGNCFLLTGRNAQARAEYLAALEGGLQDPELFNNAAELFLLESPSDPRVVVWAQSAVSGFEQRLQSAPSGLGKEIGTRKLAFALGTLGSAQQTRGQLDEACKSFRRSLELLGDSEPEVRKRRSDQIRRSCLDEAPATMGG